MTSSSRSIFTIQVNSITSLLPSNLILQHVSSSLGGILPLLVRACLYLHACDFLTMSVLPFILVHCMWKPWVCVMSLPGLDAPLHQYPVSEWHLSGLDLLQLTCEDLEKLEVHKIGHQELILEAVEKLCSLVRGWAETCVFVYSVCPEQRAVYPRLFAGCVVVRWISAEHPCLVCGVVHVLMLVHRGGLFPTITQFLDPALACTVQPAGLSPLLHFSLNFHIKNYHSKIVTLLFQLTFNDLPCNQSRIQSLHLMIYMHISGKVCGRLKENTSTALGISVRVFTCLINLTSCPILRGSFLTSK